MRLFVCAVLFTAAPWSALAASCESLSTLQLPNAKITLAQTVDAEGAKD
jgi:hypothetical protein